MSNATILMDKLALRYGIPDDPEGKPRSWFANLVRALNDGPDTGYECKAVEQSGCTAVFQMLWRNCSK